MPLPLSAREEVWIVSKGIKSMEKPRKKLHPLEKGLLKTLINPPDSDQRKRYLKRWIYGEGISPKPKRSIAKRIFRIFSR